jgi:hypothetical protein
MPLSNPQQLVADCPIRFRVVVAGRRVGKTHLAIREMCKFARLPDKNIWYLTNSRQQAKSLVWNKLKRKLKSLNWIRDTNESELSITLINNSRISLKSAEQGDNLRGESLSFVCIDEFCDINLETIWAQIVRPALSDQKGHALFTGTPKAGNQYARDLYDRYLTEKGWMSFSFTTAAGGFVDEDELAQARRDLAPKIFKQEYEASWEALGNVIFEEFGEHNIQPVARPKENEELTVGLDFNVGMMCAQVGRRTKDGLEYFDEIILKDSNTQEMADEIRARYPKNPITVIPDASGSQRKTSAGGMTDHNILYNAKFKLQVNRANPTVRDRINCANSLFFLRPDGTTRFKIDPSCKHTIKSFKNWTWKENSVGVPDKESGWDHACDSGSYPIAMLFPITRNITPQAPQRWTVR